jgi:hypothetical protein
VFLQEKEMTIFDQRGQQVNQQFNIVGDTGDINFRSVQNRLDVITQMQRLQDKVIKAVEAGVFNEDTAIEVEYKIKKAVQQAQKETPDKKTIVDYLSQAKDLIAGITAATGLVTALNQAIAAVLAFFLMRLLGETRCPYSINAANKYIHRSILLSLLSLVVVQSANELTKWRKLPQFFQVKRATAYAAVS